MTTFTAVIISHLLLFFTHFHSLVVWPSYPFEVSLKKKQPSFFSLATCMLHIKHPYSHCPSRCICRLMIDSVSARLQLSESREKNVFFGLITSSHIGRNELAGSGCSVDMYPIKASPHSFSFLFCIQCQVTLVDWCLDS